MGCALFLLDAVLPLQGLAFNPILLTHLDSWLLLPTHILFPHSPVIPRLPGTLIPTVTVRWQETALLFGAFLNIFLLYLLAIHLLAQRISPRYILISTVLLGLLYILIPAVTSNDVFSYIAYARIGVLYHLNPMTTPPVAISSDLVYWRLSTSWLKQPSAYGPTWTLFACFLQWLTATFGFIGIVPMVLALRIAALSMHLGSSWLVWSISGHMQRFYGAISPEKRLRATLAFAWNPLLLFEACINAHNDTALLFFILLTIWFLIRSQQPGYILAAGTFALATCLKLTALVLAPGLLLFLWMQHPWKGKRIITATATYLGIILFLYTPLWQHGTVLDVLLINPAAYSNYNSLSESLSFLYIGIRNGIASAHGYHHFASYSSSRAEHFTHILSIASFIIIYGLICWRATRAPHRIDTVPRLIGWLVVVWLLYCLMGSPWFWPWYAITFFGLYALVEATDKPDLVFYNFLQLPLAARLLTFSLLSLYCFLSGGPMTTVIPGLPGFVWAYLRGLWVWAVPLLALCCSSIASTSLAKHRAVTSQGQCARSSTLTEGE